MHSASTTAILRAVMAELNGINIEAATIDAVNCIAIFTAFPTK
jgi:hypothetical protein